MRVSFHGIYGELNPLPGCSQVCVSHDVFTHPLNRGKGNGKAAMYDRLKHCFYELGYDMVLCTVTAQNDRQIRLMKRYGWILCTTFKSSKTENFVRLYKLSKDDFERTFPCVRS